MKTREAAKMLKAMMPAEFYTVLDRCHNLPELEVAVAAYNAGSLTMQRICEKHNEQVGRHLIEMGRLEARIETLEGRVKN